MISHRSKLRSTIQLRRNGLAALGDEHNRSQNGRPDSVLVLMSHMIVIPAPGNKPLQVNRRVIDEFQMRNRRRSGSCAGHKTFKRVHLAAN